MVATAPTVHERVDVGTPFYASSERPDVTGAGEPALHKFDRADFVDRFLGELATAVAGQGTPSLLRPPASGGFDFDTDALDFLGQRFRKLYQPGHFRFYLAACELRCLVPGFPAPARAKIKKVELVIRRVEIKKKDGTSPEVGEQEWAWVTIPAPGMFPETPPAESAPIALSPRLTGNTRTWWPIPTGQSALEGEERFKMSRAMAPGLESRALYFGFLPLASGEMYGPKAISSAAGARNPVLGKRVTANKTMRPEVVSDYIGPPDFGSPPSLSEAELAPLRPLIPAPSRFPLSPASIKGWFKTWKSVLGMLGGDRPGGPRPKLEPPRLDGDPDGGWAYVVRCVATLEPAPGCVVEQWGPPSPPSLIAPHFDPFGGRPTHIEIPSPAAIKKMIGTLLPSQIAQRGGLGVAMKNNSAAPTVQANPVEVTDPDEDNGAKEICFFGLPLITLCAYIMFSIALAIVIVIFPFQIFLRFKFCLPIGPKDT